MISYLYQATVNPFQSSTPNVTPIQIYNNKGELKALKAFQIDPYSTTGWSLQSIINQFKQLIFGQLSLPIQIESKHNSTTAFIKIEDLSREFNLSNKELKKKICQFSSSTAYLTNHNIEKVIEKIEKLASKAFSSDEKQSLKHLINRIGYKNIFKILDHEEFESQKIIEIFTQYGRPSIATPQSESKYEIENNSSGIFISTKKTNLTGQYLLTLNLENLQFTREKQHNSPVLSLNRPIKTSTKSNDLTSLVNYGNRLGFDLKKEQTEFLRNLSQNVPIENLIKLLNQISLENQTTLFNTYLKIGQAFSPSLKSPFGYYGREKDRSNQVNVFAFGINGKGIFINLKKEKTIEQGGWKLVTNAVKLNDLTPFIRAKLAPLSNSPTTQEIEQREQARKFLKSEVNLLTNMHRQKPVSNLIDSYEFAFSFKNKFGRKNYVAFQKQCNLTGKQVLKASPSEQLVAFLGAARGLDALHQKNKAHLDFKLANLLIDGDLSKVDNIKLADFGTVVKLGKKISGGTLKYLPKEAISVTSTGIKFNSSCITTSKIDSYSLGAVIFEVLAQDIKSSKHVPLSDICLSNLNSKELQQTIKIVKDHILSKYQNEDQVIKLGMLNICSQLLQEDVNKRITCKDVAHKLSLIVQQFNIKI